MPKYLITLDVNIEAEIEAPDEETALLKVEHEILAEASDAIEVELIEDGGDQE